MSSFSSHSESEESESDDSDADNSSNDIDVEEINSVQKCVICESETNITCKGKCERPFCIECANRNFVKASLCCFGCDKKEKQQTPKEETPKEETPNNETKSLTNASYKF